MTAGLFSINRLIKVSSVVIGLLALNDMYQKGYITKYCFLKVGWVSIGQVACTGRWFVQNISFFAPHLNQIQPTYNEPNRLLTILSKLHSFDSVKCTTKD